MPTESETNLDLPLLRSVAAAEVTHKPGAVRLDGHPKIVYAPLQWGPGMRTEDNGTLVSDLCAAVVETPDYDAVAEKFKTTREHVAAAVAYALAHVPADEAPAEVAAGAAPASEAVGAPA